MKSNNSSLTGILLLVLLWMTYIYITSPSPEQIKQEQEQAQQLISEQQLQDSLKNSQDSVYLQQFQQIQQDSQLTITQRDSLKQQLIEQKIGGKYGVFLPAAQGTDGEAVLENEKLKITFSKKGGKIAKVEVKGFLQYNQQTADPYDKEPLLLMNDTRDKFEYQIPIHKTDNGIVNTGDLYFEPKVEGNSIRLTATGKNGKTIEQKYTLGEDYVLDYDLTLNGVGDLLTPNKPITLDWISYPAKIEKNPYYEQTMTTVYYQEDDFSYCECRTSDEQQLANPIQWLSHSQQFFNTSLIAKSETQMQKADLSTVVTSQDSNFLKQLSSKVVLETKKESSTTYAFEMYIGPNDYDELVKLGNGIEQIIPFGWSIFGMISRYLIRPLFNVFAMLFSNYGIIILLLTFLIRLAIFPLQYKMLKNGVKMSVLKPELETMRKKYKDDQQGMQMAQMKLYGDYGVSPLGGCLPMLLTMPVWIALYRFFPASIDFRQQSFLWADDLVSYDSIWDFGYVPFINSIYGDHVSLFTLLWVVSMFAFTWYNSKHMDMTAGNPQMQAMKYMQYAFPVLFFFALNSWAAALTAYMLFSNVLNITQTYVVKNILIDKDKLKLEMEETKKTNQSKPQKKGGMFAQYQQMLDEQQKQQKKNKKK